MDTLNVLEASIPELQRAADVAGLRRVQTEAEQVAQESSGRLRRKGNRVARKARSAIETLRGGAAETEDERVAREIRELRDARWKTRDLGIKLAGRFASTLRLLLGDDNPGSEAAASFSVLTTHDGDDGPRLEIPDLFKAWLPLIIDGYQRSLDVFTSAGTATVTDERRSVERVLKTVAVDLMTRGNEVRGLQDDAVPLLAYALFNGIVPAVPGMDSADTDEQINDVLLGIAEEVSEMPPESRRVFISLFRLSVLLGEAQAYADKLSLVALDITGSPSSRSGQGELRRG